MWKKKKDVRNVDDRRRYLCKNCGCNYTGIKSGYLGSVKQEAIKYHIEGIGFRKIEILLQISHVSVINRVRKDAKKYVIVKQKRRESQIF